MRCKYHSKLKPPDTYLNSIYTNSILRDGNFKLLYFLLEIFLPVHFSHIIIVGPQSSKQH